MTQTGETKPIQVELFEKHFTRFFGEVGDKVVFKRPKRPRTIWEVVEVETDWQAVKWSSGGQTPNYIKLRGMVSGKEVEVWTCENKIRPYGDR